MRESDASLVAKRLRYIDRQRELHRHQVNVAFEGRAPEGTGAPNRHGMPQLPIGQRQVTNWPVLDLGDSPRVAFADWRLDVGFRTLSELAVPTADVTHVLCTGYDHMPGTRIPYTTNLPLVRAVEDDVMLVHSWEGEPLPPEHGGPCRMITPKLYAWKGTKWIRKIEFLSGNQPGFWEERGYSDTAEPWFDDRYS